MVWNAYYDSALDLDSFSWPEINDAAKNGVAKSLWSIGDSKAVVLNGTVQGYTFDHYSTRAFIIGFDHNSSREGNNTIHFQIGLSGKHEVAFCDGNYSTSTEVSNGFIMNQTATNVGGWSESYMRSTVLGNSSTPMSPLEDSFLSILPSDLREVIRVTKKWTNNVGNANQESGSVTETSDYLFLLSCYEMCGEPVYADPHEDDYQNTYEYYGSSGLVTNNHNDLSAVCQSWLRSPFKSKNTSFCCTTTNTGYPIICMSNKSLGICPCFSVGEAMQ